MVEWNGWFVNAEQVDSVKVYTNGDMTRVKICMRNGDGIVCDYASEEAARKSARLFSAQVDRDRDAGRAERTLELLRGDMTVIRSGIGLLDKRQRRLWRKLRESAPGTGEEDAEL